MKNTGRVRTRPNNERIEIGEIEQMWRSTREGKLKLSGSQPSRLATMLNTSAFSLSTRFEALANLVKSGQTNQAGMRFLQEIADIRKELTVCRDVGYHVLCKMREERS